MHKNRTTCSEPPDFERLVVDLQSPDERVRAKAVGSLCPCRVGIDVFQQHLDIVAQFRKDPGPAVRASVLHVFEEAAEGQNEGYPTNPREITNEMLRRRRVSRFPSNDIEEAQGRKIKRGRGRIRAKA